jgi:hypothetical protein
MTLINPATKHAKRKQLRQKICVPVVSDPQKPKRKTTASPLELHRYLQPVKPLSRESNGMVLIIFG